MSRKASLDSYIDFQENTEKEEKKSKEEKTIKKREKKPKKKKKIKKEKEKKKDLDIKTETKDIEKCLLLSVDYDGTNRLGYCRLYDLSSRKLIFWYDNSDHKPYLLTDLSIKELNQKYPEIKNHKGFIDYKELKKYDLITDQLKDMVKVIADDPLSIGGRQDSIREHLEDHSFEATIVYHRSFLYDKQLIPGMFYHIKNNRLKPVKTEIPQDLKNELIDSFKDEKKDFQRILPGYLNLFFSPIPDIRRLAFDIEVKTVSNKIPDPSAANQPVICISFVDSDGNKKIFLLKDHPLSAVEKEKIKDIEADIRFFEKERELLEESFKLINNYPIVITYNGDNFDMPYIDNRSTKLRIKRNEKPFVRHRNSYSLNNGIHLDLYRFFFNRALRVSAFGNAYKTVSLEAVSSALLEEGKIELEKEIHDLSYHKLAEYCLRDSDLTLRLTTYDNNLVLKLLILLMRITKLPIEDISRSGISNWIKNLFYFEHRARNYLIPNPNYLSEIKSDAATEAMIKGKKYKGAKVIDPIPGVHFNVVVLDFASLYPSVIKEWNLSYETVNCPHEECRDNLIPNTPHWVCKKRVGISSLLIGLLRDLRVKYFKIKAKDKALNQELRNLFNIVQASMKVIINAAYGVFGAEIFPLYCLPMAESTSAIGRYAIEQTIEKVHSMGLRVIYGDTDSVFIEDPTKEQINELIEWSIDELGIELDIEKSFRFSAHSERKKNYLGVYDDGSVDIKGLSGKKRNTPLFIQNAFREMIDVLSEVHKPEDFDEAKQQIKHIIKRVFKKLKNYEYTPDELAFKVQITKPIEKYSVIPQHVKAAKILMRKTGADIGKGNIIYFLKTRDPNGVQPAEIANIRDLDVKKYKETVESTFDQVLDALGIDFEELQGKRTLDRWM
ncbi:MAG: DNA-directed DNA polymerase I [Candidatus Lokiarchaeota archaeon]|nr:DNA-directed DNA polymerase I [Candidatus Lokiarchaeota archaeon]